MNQLETDMQAQNNPAKIAFRFVLIIGIVNFFADMTYEGGRSITGPFSARSAPARRLSDSSPALESCLAIVFVRSRAIWLIELTSTGW